MKNITGLLLLGMSTMMLGACTSERMLQRCPAVAVLAEASSLTEFTPGAALAPESEIYRIDARRLTTDCVLDEDKRIAESSLDFTLRARRAAGGAAAQYTVPYFVAVNGPDGKVTQKKSYSTTISFAAGETVKDISENVRSTMVKVAPERMAFDYQILVGLQLSKAQLDYNRKMNRYAE